MYTVWFIVYNLFVVPFIYIGFYTGSLFNAKIKEGRKARKGMFATLRNEIKQADENRPRIFFHCTSAGEWLQALPIIEKMKTLNPRLFIIVSFFSPSGYKFAKKPPEVDLKFYLPLDSYFAAKKLFKIIKPRLWIISKFDVWPNHVFAASNLGIPIVVTSATLSPDSRRDKNISKWFNRVVYSRISHFFPISEPDRDRFLNLVPVPEKYTIAGDTRYDHVYNRGQRANDAGDVAIFTHKKSITFIAGSTWPPDEKHVLPSLVSLLSLYQDIQVIVVPHELHENHLKDIEAVFNEAKINTVRFTDFSANGTTNNRVVIFNTVGLLARLYKQTDIAFIGGSFGKGTHNVMEPAIFGQPVLFGPNHWNSHEAGELLGIGAAFCVNNSAEILEKADLLIRDEVLRREMGDKARNLIQNNIGATDIIINKLKKQYGFIS